MKADNTACCPVSRRSTRIPSPIHASAFSPYDNHQEPELVENLVELDPRTRLISVVAGKQSLCGRYYASPQCPLPLRELVAVGDQLSFFGLDGLPPAPAPKPAEIFDRGKALTGSGALHRLSRMTIAVVGASGIGSLFGELLARAGCKNIILIDHDIVKRVNLNRVLHATAEDARLGTPKVVVLRRAIEALGRGCRVKPIQGSILDRNVLRRVLDADLVVGCLDRDLPRHLLCELAFQFLLPYVDVGSEIGGDNDGIVSVDSRVSYVVPGRHCLRCAGVVTPRRLRFESLTEQERKREIALGYSDDLLMTQPAVMDLNMWAASNGMILLRHLLQPFLHEPYPIKLCENAVIYRSRPVTSALHANPACPTCRTKRRLGDGDCGPAIGFDAETARGIMGCEVEVIAEQAPYAAHVEHGIGRPHFLRRAQAAISRFLGRRS